MATRRKPKPAAKAAKRKEHVEPHFGGAKRAPARKPRKTSQTGSTIRRALLRGLYTPIALIALIIVGSFLYFVARLPDPILLTLDDRPPNLTILASDGTVLAERGLRRGYVRLDRLPPYLPQAVIATEDRRFYNHRRRPGRPRPCRHAQSHCRQRGAGRLDHHPAARQEPVPVAGPHHGAQARRGDVRHLARAALHQGRDPRALSQPGLFRRGHLWRRGCGAALFRTLGAFRDLDAGGAACRPAQGSVALCADAQCRARHYARRRGARQYGRGRISHQRGS